MKIWKFFFLFASLLVLTITVNFILDNWHYRQGDHRRLQNALDRKFRKSDRIYDRLIFNRWELDTPLPRSDGIIMLSFRNDSLKYWSDNSISFSSLSSSILDERRFEFISNGWYVVKPYVNDSIRAYALILIKTEYSYDNKFLQNGFHPDLRLPESTELLTSPQTGSYSVHDWEGIYLFSIRFNTDELRFAQLEKYLVPALIFLTLLALLLFIHHAILSVRRNRIRNYFILILPLIFAGLRYVMYRFHVPKDLFALELFGPIPFAKSDWLPSLGDVFLNTLLILFVTIQFFISFRLSERVYKGRNPGNLITVSILVAIFTGFFVYTHNILSNLILHSSISFEFYKAAGLSIYTSIGLVIMVMHFAVLLLISNKLMEVCRHRCRFSKLLTVFLIAGGGIMVLLYFCGYKLDPGAYLAYVVIFITPAVMHYRKVPLGNHTPMAIMVILFSIFSVYIIAHYNNRKVVNNMAVLAENLAAQHDPVAEYLLEDISERLQHDVNLSRYLLYWNSIDAEQQHNYLRSNYFYGFWGKYMLIHTVCSPEDDVYGENCYDWFNNRLEEGKSMKLSNADFYFLDNQNGRINYLGMFRYYRPDSTDEKTLFIELESRLVAEELGFPDLLLDERYQKNKLLEEYSYAKYYKNQLMAQSGTFQYSLDLNTYRNRPSTFDGYVHYINYSGSENAVMVSRPRTTFFNNLVSFSYIFIFYYIIVLFFILSRDFSKLGTEIEFNFKNKIQLSITALIFLSLFLVGGGTIYFTIEQYQRKQHDILSEKIQSVYVELDLLLAYFTERIPPDWSDGIYANLNQLLIKLSDVFYSDINLYDPEGNLIATSRQEIFSEGLLGERMDPMAYSAMVKEKQAEYIHRETIGDLSFISAYVPFVSAVNNKLLAYINLPYFTRQNVLRNDITTLVVAIINVYVLLILVAIAMAALISDEITRPLKMIQQRFSQMKLGRKSEPIIYKGRDEIAGLVNEYNRMMKELVHSIDMLAQSERESAWREMAKQVAHEIKNPLTPMKLSVQHLLRSWKDNKENFDEYLEKVTRTLIEQIDNLSFIASEFSNFAKMPKAVSEEINIVDSVRSTLNLYSNTENVDFVFEYESDYVPVYADKEQLSRVFINLIKNAIQSIPDNRQGKVVISLVQNRNDIRINITDNGKGIPEELQNKLFTPSFTTKSSGMGLGLSIVKSIIVSFGGDITFKTKVNLGTTFTIELPVYRRDESAGKG